MEGTDNINFIYKFNNKSRSSGFFLLYILSGAVLLGVISYFIFANLNLLLVITIVIAVIYFILFHLFKPSFLELIVFETEIQVNYYSVTTAIKSYQTVVIEKEVFKGFEIKYKYGRIRKQLILTVESKLGLADYPPISVSILTKKELNQVLHVLTKLIDNPT